MYAISIHKNIILSLKMSACCGDNKVSERVGELRRLYFQQIHQNLAEIHVRSVICDK